MESMSLWPWMALLLLGALHGINPGMGWLFAVALGLQEEKGRAVWRALPPLALGHALSIALAVAVAGVIGLVIAPELLRWVVAATLLALGVHRLRRHRHPRYGGMRVGPRDLTIWSFLMASAHGAGLMVLPLLVGERTARFAGAVGAGHGAHAPMVHGMDAAAGARAADHGVALLAGLPAAQTTGLAVTLVHTLGYLLVTGVVAVVVYEKLGLKLLRTAWINLDLIWAGALIVTALVTPFL